ncbi:MAG: hypothetical protein IT376_05960 [Polyangiaceae bacterium]|nr:hypothetical protein [Polyangiaceae bacterium]
MSRRLRPALALAVAAAAGGVARPVVALEPGSVGGAPVHVDVTEASSLLYNADNRDTSAADVSTLANDGWALWYNRVTLRASSGEWQAGLRLDSALFLLRPNPVQIGLDLVELRARPLPPGAVSDPVFFRRKVDAAGLELSNRYIDWVYPAKWDVGWTSRDLELTAGDFSAQLGRGYVLSVRKLDELSSDTTLRGARATYRARLGPELRLRVTGLGGSGNPLRIDEASGRYLGVDSSVTPSWLAVTEAGMPRATETDFAPDTGECATFETCTYAPDRLVAAQIELAAPAWKLGTQGSLLVRQAPLQQDVVRSADRTLTASQSLELPRLGEHLSAYAEAALQRLERGGEPSLAARGGPSLGHALYFSTSAVARPVVLTFEGKHHRRFFPLRSNVKLARANEFATVGYNAPPTTEPQWVDTAFEGYDTCVSGGRLRGDLEVGDGAGVFLWAGRWSTWAESVSNERCEIRRAFENRVWDVASGLELEGSGGRSRANVTLGGRLDETARPLAVEGGETTLFYAETYARYDVILPLGGALALQNQGVHRRRRQTVGNADAPWVEGQHLLGVDWRSTLSVAGGFEYDTRPGEPGTYVNGQVTWRPTSDSSVGVFVGQRRGALRCVGGVCRVFPPFEGARLDLTARF